MIRFRTVLILFIAPFLFVQGARAVGISGFTTLDVDPTTGMVTATCETDLSLYARAFYDATVYCDIYDGAGNWMAGDAQDDFQQSGSAQVTVSFRGIPGTAYRAIGTHSAFAVVETDEPSPFPPHRIQAFYSDPYDLEYFSLNPVYGYYDGVYIQDPYQSYTWEAPGLGKKASYSNIFTGNTRDAKVYPIDTNLAILYAQGAFSQICDGAFAKVIGPSYTNASFFQSLLNTNFSQYPLGTPNIPSDAPQGADAYTQITVPGRPITLLPNFYGRPGNPTSDTFREFVIVHEGVHHFTGWTDQNIFTNFYSVGLRSASGYSGDFTDWITAGCPPS